MEYPIYMTRVGVNMPCIDRCARVSFPCFADTSPDCLRGKTLGLLVIGPTISTGLNPGKVKLDLEAYYNTEATMKIISPVKWMLSIHVSSILQCITY
jgi:hypothetical protein